VTYRSRTRFGRMTPQVELPFYGCLAADEPCVPDRPCCGIDSDQVPGALEAFIWSRLCGTDGDLDRAYISALAATVAPIAPLGLTMMQLESLLKTS